MSRKRQLPSHLNDFITNKKVKPNSNAPDNNTNSTRKRKAVQANANSRKKPKLHKQTDAKPAKKKALTDEEKLAEKLEKASNQRTTNNWTKSGASFVPAAVEKMENCGPRAITIVKQEFTEVDAFMLLAKDLIDNLVQTMNNNRSPNGIIEYKATDSNEVLRFWTSLIALAFVKFQSLDDAWANSSMFGSTTVQNLIGKNRFHELLSMLQLDVVEWAAIINKNSTKYWKENQTQTIDDAHPAWSGRSYLVTHKPRKKKPDGTQSTMVLI